MYIIIEGMPGTGKTSLSRMLAEKLDAVYVKSTFSNTDYGDKLRDILNSGKEKEAEFFYLTDLLLDELRVRKLLSENKSVVRDKTYTSSLSHLRTHGFVNSDTAIAGAIYDSYILLSEMSLIPDKVIYIKSDRDKICSHIMQKNDLSKWDMELSENLQKHETQRQKLENELQRKYSDKLIDIDCFSDTTENMCDFIIEKISEGKNNV